MSKPVPMMRTRTKEDPLDPTVLGWLQGLGLSEVDQFSGSDDEFIMAISGKHSLSRRLVRLTSGALLGLPEVPTVVVAQDYPNLSSHAGDALVAAVRWLLFGLASESVSGVSRTHGGRFALLLSTIKPKLAAKTLTPFETLARALNQGPTALRVELWLQEGAASSPRLHAIPATAFNLSRPPSNGTNSEKVWGWAEDLDNRSTLLGSFRPLADALAKEVNDPSFRWYLPSTGKQLSGRVEGLEVCKLKPDGTRGTVTVGKDSGPPASQQKAGRRPTAREIFLDLLWKTQDARSLLRTDALDLTAAGIALAAEVIRKVVTERKGSGRLAGEDREHRLEAQILRGAVKLRVGPQDLLPVEPDHPFQFPTLWHDEKRSTARYLDALMRLGSTPWAVEVKVNTSSGPGSYYSHGITQAVLYREFIREAAGTRDTPFFDWFDKKNLEPDGCRGMLVIEPIQARGGGIDHRRTKELRGTARCFGVELTEAVAVP